MTKTIIVTADCWRKTDMSKQTIWNYLKTHTDLTEQSIAGIMGNLEAESNCESVRVQGDFSVDRNASKAYVQMIDNGTLTEDQMASDQRGFGLAQWTYPQRKRNLLSSCKSQGKSIGDEEAQLAFMLSEMQNEYATMWRTLLSCKDISVAAYLVCHNYERPAFENTAIRTSLGQKIYDEFHGTEVPPVDTDYCIDKAIALLEEALKILKGE